MGESISTALGELWQGSSIVTDFTALCDCGGRLAGTDSELAARQYLGSRLDELGGRRSDFTFSFTGMLPDGAELTLHGAGRPATLEAAALPGAPPVTGTELEVIDLGTGTELDFAAAGAAVAGKAVLVAHEYPFSTGHTHRRRKYDLACAAGAAAFLIANNTPTGGVVTGGCGRGGSGAIPAAGLSYDAGQRLRAAGGGARITLTVASHEHTWPATNLILDLPGQGEQYVLLCAHIDGHELAESAMDNATGLSAVLEVGRRLAPLVGKLRRGLRLALFTVEEWGLEGSRRYLAELSAAERSTIATAICLDSITGHPRLSALTGADPGIERLLTDYTAATGVPIDVVRPELANSDHYNFQRAGIPAMRLIAGYGRPESLTRHLLTPADTRAMVDLSQLKAAALTTAALVHAACG